MRRVPTLFALFAASCSFSPIVGGVAVGDACKIDKDCLSGATCTGGVCALSGSGNTGDTSSTGSTGGSGNTGDTSSTGSTGDTSSTGASGALPTITNITGDSATQAGRINQGFYVTGTNLDKVTAAEVSSGSTHIALDVGVGASASTLHLFISDSAEAAMLPFLGTNMTLTLTAPAGSVTALTQFLRGAAGSTGLSGLSAASGAALQNLLASPDCSPGNAYTGVSAGSGTLTCGAAPTSAITAVSAGPGIAVSPAPTTSPIVALNGQLSGLEITTDGSAATPQLTLEAQNMGDPIRMHLSNLNADSQWYFRATTAGTPSAASFAIGFYEAGIDNDKVTILGDGRIGITGKVYARGLLSGANAAAGRPIGISVNASSAQPALQATNTTATGVGLRVDGPSDLITPAAGAAGLTGGSLQATNVAVDASLYNAANPVDLPIYLVTNSALIDPNGNMDRTAVCQAGDIVISGGCETPDTATGGLIPRMYITPPATFTCNFTGNPAAPETYSVFAICMKSR